MTPQHVQLRVSIEVDGVPNLINHGASNLSVRIPNPLPTPPGFLTTSRITLRASLTWKDLYGDSLAGFEFEQGKAPEEVQIMGILSNGYFGTILGTHLHRQSIVVGEASTSFTAEEIGYQRTEEGSRTPSTSLCVTCLVAVLPFDPPIGVFTKNTKLTLPIVDTSCSMTNLPERIIQQEYVDFGIDVPSYDTIRQIDSKFNTGNYLYPAVSLGPGLPEMPEFSFGVDGGLGSRFGSIFAAYRASEVLLPGGEKLLVDGETVRMPGSALLSVNSGYRNPRRNAAIPGKKTSLHMWGRALDLVPEKQISAVTSKGTAVALHRDQHLFPTLFHTAKGLVGFLQLEKKHDPVPLGTPDSDHIHVQW